MKHPLWWRERNCEDVALANALKNLTGDEWAGDIAFVIDNRVWMFHFYS